jgi:Rad3-related DNA helicase
VMFQPVWGRRYVRPQLLKHYGENLTDDGIQRVLFTSASLLDIEYTAELMGIPEDSYAYLDLPSTFPVENRPVNYSPVCRMNKDRGSTVEGRREMQSAIDEFIGFYLSQGRGTGLIHAVSNRYRDNILTESRWHDILTSDPEEHRRKVERGLPSVIVAANMTEGWDGVDDLARFILMPKAPYPNLGDPRVRARYDADGRSFDHSTLVSVVQGAGRGVRHKEDTADTWILDEAWGRLYRSRKDVLPTSFKDAYHHRVSKPWE